MAKTDETIKQLKESNFYTECPYGEGEFKLSDAILFDGTKPFPAEATSTQNQLTEVLKEKEVDLKKRRERATKKAQITTKAVNLGKNFEKIFPAMAAFKWSLPDTRFLGDPIDMIAFNGLSAGKVGSISFIEIKTGGARLNDHQKAVKEAVEDKRVSYKVLE